MQLAAIDTPSGSVATSRYAADENATYGAGVPGHRPVGDLFMNHEILDGLCFFVKKDEKMNQGNIKVDNNPVRLKQFTTTVRDLEFQIPIPKFQTISKFESPMTQTFWCLTYFLMAVLHVFNFEFRSLVFVCYLVLDAWNFHDLFNKIISVTPTS